MLKHPILVAVMALGLLACASTPAPKGEGQVATAMSWAHPANRAQLATCEATGSRIPRKPGEGVPAPCRQYSGADIRRTGTTSLKDALRMLDPAIQ